MGVRVREGQGWPGLDGLRALAALSVVDYHLGLIPGVRIASRGGYLAVDVFFVLSGFLITDLCLREWNLTGGITLGRFYLRRLLRLYPALLLVVAVAVLLVDLVPDMASSAGATHRGLTADLLYYSNIQVARDVFIPGALGQLWSLATEEQFYILWAPILLLLLRLRVRRTRLAVALLVLAGAETLGRTLVVGDHPPSLHWYFRIYFAPDLHSDGLLIGCAVALLVSAVPRTGRHPGRWAVLGVVSLASLGAAAVEIGASESTLRWAPALASLMAVPCILSCVRYPAGVLARGLGAPPLRWIGRRSYGVYLWHFPLLQLVLLVPALHDHGQWASASEVLALTLAASAASWALLEAPVLRVRDRLLPTAPTPGAAMAGATMAGAAMAGAAMAPLRPPVVTGPPALSQPGPTARPGARRTARRTARPTGLRQPVRAGRSAALLDRVVAHPMWSWPLKPDVPGAVPGASGPAGTTRATATTASAAAAPATVHGAVAAGGPGAGAGDAGQPVRPRVRRVGLPAEEQPPAGPTPAEPIPAGHGGSRRPLDEPVPG